MTTTETLFATLPQEVAAQFSKVFETPERCYAVTYLIARNEHVLQTEKPDKWEEKLQVIHLFQKKIELFFTTLGWDAKEIMADIASDYFEDYVAYQERDFGLTNDEFLALIRSIQTLPN